LRSADLRDGRAVSGADVVDASLTGADINEASLDGLGGVEVVEAQGPFSAGFFHDAFAQCPDGKRAIAGGYRLSNKSGSSAWQASITAIAVESKPAPGGTGWEVEIATPNQEQIKVIAFATCVRVAAEEPSER
jgi:hypothetical protein